MEWNAPDYINQRKKKQEIPDFLKELESNLEDVDLPCVVTDRSGSIVSWHLPNLLDKRLLVIDYPHFVSSKLMLKRKQGELNEATKLLSALMQKIGIDNGSQPKWRNDPSMFIPSTTGDVEHGCLDISPSWFALAHEVRPILTQSSSLTFFVQMYREPKIQ